MYSYSGENDYARIRIWKENKMTIYSIHLETVLHYWRLVPCSLNATPALVPAFFFVPGLRPRVDVPALRPFPRLLCEGANVGVSS